MKEKVLVLAFNGDVICFAHALLHALDMRSKGLTVRVMIEGNACRLLENLETGNGDFASLFEKVKATGMIEGVCASCSDKLSVRHLAQKRGLPVLDDMYGHAGLTKYVREGYQILTF